MDGSGKHNHKHKSKGKRVDGCRCTHLVLGHAPLDHLDKFSTLG